MRIVGLGERIEEKLHLLFPVFLVNVARETIVAARDQLRTGLDRVFAQFFLKQLVGNPSHARFDRLPLHPLARALFGGSTQW